MGLALPPEVSGNTLWNCHWAEAPMGISMKAKRIRNVFVMSYLL
jgi:hypothetical protein